MRKINLLTDALPDSITVFGKVYPVHTSFRNWVRIALLAGNGEKPSSKKTAEMLSLCYKEELPPNLISALLGLERFLNRGADFSAPVGNSAPLFSFAEDSERIYAAFYKSYGIDLAKEDLHWYTFCALFSSLPEENPFATVLKIRSMDEKEITDKEAKRKIRKLKNAFALKGEGREIDVAEEICALF